MLVYVLRKTRNKHFRVVVLQKQQRNVQKKFDARAKLLFCLLNQFYSFYYFDVLVAVASLDLKVLIVH